MKHARTCGDVSDATWRMFLLERAIRRELYKAIRSTLTRIDALHAPTFTVIRGTVSL